MTTDKKKHEQDVIRQLRSRLKEDPVALEHCREYDTDPDFIDTVPIRFEPLDVSAKTVNGEVILNSHLLEGDPRDSMRYLVHEFVHCLQQENGKVDGSSRDQDYLDDPNEMEAFQAQLDYMDGPYSGKERDEYVERLLDHHGLEGKDREKKKEELLAADGEEFVKAAASLEEETQSYIDGLLRHAEARGRERKRKLRDLLS